LLKKNKMSLFFTSNSAVFVGGVAKILFALWAQGTLTMSLASTPLHVQCNTFEKFRYANANIQFADEFACLCP